METNHSKLSLTNADVIEEAADELGAGGCMSDGRFDDEFTFDGCVGDELSQSISISLKINESIFGKCNKVSNSPFSNRWHRIQ